uniref:AAA+ ATPase domain-containing protein n=2 Tax=Lactuca sativa TaxID=4236 RepID=A0A9R1XG13_LACSA|nr:hypothetical protein LSAT_V11C500272730 [Lactuca sativa]
MMTAQISKAPMTMANLLLNAAQTPKPSMATTGNLLLTPPLLLIPPLMMFALKSTQQPPLFKNSFLNTSRSKKSFSYTPPTSSSTRPLSLRLSWNNAAVPISPVHKKDHKGFGGNMSCADFWGPLSGWDDVVQMEKKFVCGWAAKEDSTVAGTEDDFAPTLLRMWHSWYYLQSWKNFGKRKDRNPSKKQCVTFNDVEGVDAAKAELLEIVSCIKGDSKYMKLGAKLPRGVLLAGPPGTGKTLLARAVAGEANVAFFSMSASEFVEIFAGNGAARVRNLFSDARKRSPSIIFIDEIDAVGGQRGISFNSERDQTLNQLLTEMDGFEKGATVVVIAATNRPELLDSALMRPGRFSRKVVVGKPDEDGRRKIFSLYLEKVPMDKEDKQVICDIVASRTPGLVGADLENIANEAVMLAARTGGDYVTKEDVLQALERSTTKICNDDATSEAKSPYLFGQMALESVQAGGY